MSKIVCGLDCETDDPLLKTAGWSWKYGKGYILNTALYYEAEDRVEVIAGLHNNNCPYTPFERNVYNNQIVALLTSPDVIIVGANLMYDIGWLLYEYGMSTYDVKCSFIDVLQAESNDTIVLMTCAGQDLGNKDATHRLIITAKYLKSS